MEKDTDKAILQGLQAWREKEQSLAEYFSPAAMKSREALKLKLDHYRELNILHGGGKSLLRGVLQAEIRNVEKQLRPNWLARQMERVTYSASLALKGLRDWLKPTLVEEKPSMFKAPEVRKEFAGQDKAQVRQQGKELPQLKVADVLRVAAKQDDKRQLLKKGQKNELLPKKKQQKSRGLNVH